MRNNILGRFRWFICLNLEPREPRLGGRQQKPHTCREFLVQACQGACSAELDKSALLSHRPGSQNLDAITATRCRHKSPPFLPPAPMWFPPRLPNLALKLQMSPVHPQQFPFDRGPPDFDGQHNTRRFTPFTSPSTVPPPPTNDSPGTHGASRLGYTASSRRAWSG